MAYNAVVGWNRGGTSCVMGALRECGIPVLGFKFPISLEVDIVDTRTGDKVEENIDKDAGVLEPVDRVRGNNPHGFWEVGSIVAKEGLKKRHEGMGEPGNLVKVPLNMLALSDAEMIDKIVVVLRNPLCVLRSQTKTNKPSDASKEGWIRLMSLVLKSNMLISVEWIRRHKIPYYFVRYEDILEAPIYELAQVCRFFNRGTPHWGAKLIDPNLNRSKPIDITYSETQELWDWWQSNSTDYRDEELKDLQKRIKHIKDEYDIEENYQGINDEYDS